MNKIFIIGSSDPGYEVLDIINEIQMKKVIKDLSDG